MQADAIHLFDMNNWILKIMSLQESHDTLDWMLQNTDAVSRYSTVRSERLVAAPDQNIDAVRDRMRLRTALSLEDALQSFHKHTIVSLASYCEAALREFTTCLFTRNPDQIPAELVGGHKGVTEMSLPEHAAKRVVAYNYKKMAKTLDRVSGGQICTNRLSSYKTIIERRNEIVHAQWDRFLVAGHVCDYFDNAITTMRSLGRAAEELQFAVDLFPHV